MANNYRNEDKYPTSNSFERFYEKGYSAFTMLGRSKMRNDFANEGNNSRGKVAQILSKYGITPSNAQHILPQFGSKIRNYERFVIAAANVYEQGIRVNDNAINEIVGKVIKEDYEIVNNKIFNTTDFIALNQYVRVRNNPMLPGKMISAVEVQRNYSGLAMNAKPHVVGNESLYDITSIKDNKVTGVLKIPFENMTDPHNTYLNNEEKVFPEYEDFVLDLQRQGYKLHFNRSFASSDETAVVEGRNIYVEGSSTPSTELAVGIMYETNLAKAHKTRFKLFDGSYKEAKNFFQSHTMRTEGGKFNPYKDFKRGKRDFEMQRATLEDIVATLTTINTARLYFSGSTFEKVEDYLTTQACRKMAKLQNTDDKWVLPYISEKVLQLTRQTYKSFGLTNLEAVKDVYRKTGVNVDNAITFEDVVFATKNYDLTKKSTKNQAEAEATKENTKTEKTNKENLKNEGPSIFDDPIQAAAIKKTALYKAFMDFYGKTKAEGRDPVKEEVKSKVMPQSIRNSALEAKDRVWDFIEDNLLMKNTFSSTSAIQLNSKYIRKLNEDPNIDMNEVAKALHFKIVKDMRNNSDAYRKTNGHFHKEGTKLFKDYMESAKEDLTPSTFFKKELKEAVEMSKNQGPEV
jgi:hypothetical protein